MRNGEDYSCYLSQKTLNNRNKTAKKTCPQCRRKFVRLDTHLRNSATCRSHPLPSHLASPPSSNTTPPSPACSSPCDVYEHSGSLAPQTDTQIFPIPRYPDLSNSQTTPDTHNPEETIPEDQTQSRTQTFHNPNSSDQSTGNSQHLSFLKLPRSPNDWQKANEELATTVVPAAISCSTVDEKNKILCEGVYQYFSQMFGTQTKQAHHTKGWRRHNRRLKKLTKLKNESRRELRKAKKDSLDEATIRTVAREFHRLLRLHSKESKISNKSKANM